MKNKIVDHINNFMSKRHVNFIRNFTALFSNVVKTEKVPKFELNIFLKTTVWRKCTCNTYIVISNAFGIKQFYIFYQ